MNKKMKRIKKAGKAYVHGRTPRQHLERGLSESKDVKNTYNLIYSEN